MRRLIAFILVLTIVMSLFTGCKKDDGSKILLQVVSCIRRFAAEGGMAFRSVSFRKPAMRKEYFVLRSVVDVLTAFPLIAVSEKDQV